MALLSTAYGKRSFACRFATHDNRPGFPYSAYRKMRRSPEIACFLPGQSHRITLLYSRGADSVFCLSGFFAAEYQHEWVRDDRTGHASLFEHWPPSVQDTTTGKRAIPGCYFQHRPCASELCYSFEFAQNTHHGLYMFKYNVGKQWLWWCHIPKRPTPNGLWAPNLWFSPPSSMYSKEQHDTFGNSSLTTNDLFFKHTSALLLQKTHERHPKSIRLWRFCHHDGHFSSLVIFESGHKNIMRNLKRSCCKKSLLHTRICFASGVLCRTILDEKLVQFAHFCRSATSDALPRAGCSCQTRTKILKIESV